MEQQWQKLIFATGKYFLEQNLWNLIININFPEPDTEGSKDPIKCLFAQHLYQMNLSCVLEHALSWVVMVTMNLVLKPN